MIKDVKSGDCVFLMKNDDDTFSPLLMDENDQRLLFILMGEMSKEKPLKVVNGVKYELRKI